MPNTHAIPDMFHEVQAVTGDLLSPCILSTTWPTVPVSSLTLAAFATHGYAFSGRDLIYIDQAAVTVTLPSAAGTYWLAMHRDVHTAVSGWSRRAGSHYIFQAAAVQPANPDGAVLLSSVTVAGSVITGVSQAGISRLPLSRQDGGSVTITGGTATLSSVTLPESAAVGAGLVGQRMAGTNKWNLFCDGTADNYLLGALGIATAAPSPSSRMEISWRHADKNGLLLRVSDSDTGAYAALVFMNLGGGVVGNITTTATGTGFNTSSDHRLKHSIAPLTDSLAVIDALNPIGHRWNADDSYAENFLAHELQHVLAYAVTGEPDAVNDDGSVRPQQVDHSKLVPRLVGAVKELLAQVQALTARVSTLEEQLGL